MKKCSECNRIPDWDTLLLQYVEKKEAARQFELRKDERPVKLATTQLQMIATKQRDCYRCIRNIRQNNL